MDKLLIAIYLALTVGGLSLVKAGSVGGAFLSKIDDKLVWNITPIFIGGIFLYGASFLLMMWLVSRFDLSYIVPITTGIGQVLIFIVAILVFKEQFTYLKMLAIGLIIVGVVLLQMKASNT